MQSLHLDNLRGICTECNNKMCMLSFVILSTSLFTKINSILIIYSPQIIGFECTYVCASINMTFIVKFVE